MEVCSNLISWGVQQLYQWIQSSIDTYSWMKIKEYFLVTHNPCLIFWVNQTLLLFMALLTKTWEVHCYHLLVPQSSENKFYQKLMILWDPIFQTGLIKLLTSKKKPRRSASFHCNFTTQYCTLFLIFLKNFWFITDGSFIITQANLWDWI